MIKRKIYVASSWRNPFQQAVINAFRQDGHEVYDFRNPKPGNKGFHWSEIDEQWEHWTVPQYVSALKHPIAQVGFKADFDAMNWSDTVVLVQPCGRSAHLEFGWACGAGKKTFMLQLEPQEPELMVKMCDGIFGCLEDLRACLLGIFQNGTPKHPLYLKKTVTPKPETTG